MLWHTEQEYYFYNKINQMLLNNRYSWSCFSSVIIDISFFSHILYLHYGFPSFYSQSLPISRPIWIHCLSASHQKTNTHVCDKNKLKNMIKQKLIYWNRTKETNTRKRKKNQEKACNRQICRDPFICTFRNPQKILNWKP